MRNMVNEVNCSGRLYSHKLELRTSGTNSKHPGTEFIRGSISIATDPEMLNIVDVFYTYVTATTASGKKNGSFTVLKNIIDGKIKNYMEYGDEADYVNVSSAIGLNEFYSSTSGQEELVSAKRYAGGFINQITALDVPDNEFDRNKFLVDMVITSARSLEPDEEKNLSARMILKGVIFDFRKAILPVEFMLYDENGMRYCESLEISNKNPVVTLIQGHQVSKTVTRKVETETSFGPPIVEVKTSSQKEFVADSFRAEPYEWNVEGIITEEELRKAMADRNVYLATLKQRQDEYNASKTTTSSGTNTGFKSVSSSDEFDF